NVVLMCAMMSILFFGGWQPPFAFLAVIPGVFWMILKVWIFFFLFAMVKAIVPRYRYDQLMRLGWKVFLPLSLVWVVFIAGWVLVFRGGS
ncbi:MAG TPA: NADH-quinone oxidoreductase subunit H, partial [Pseudolabrys sp.]